jgi:hypothetical protein
MSNVTTGRKRPASRRHEGEKASPRRSPGQAVLALLEEQGRGEPLPPDRQRFVAETIERMMDLLLDTAGEDELSGKQLRQRGQLALDTLDLVVAHPDPARLDSVADALEAVEVDDAIDVDREQAEARARLRLHALYQRIIRDSYSVAELRARSRVSRQRLKQLRDQDRLFAIEIPFYKGMLYPRWQFSLGDGKPRLIMPELIAAARDAGLDAIGFHQIMLSPAAAGGDLTPVDLLDDGGEEEVLRILRAASQ